MPGNGKRRRRKQQPPRSANASVFRSVVILSMPGVQSGSLSEAQLTLAAALASAPSFGYTYFLKSISFSIDCPVAIQSPNLAHPSMMEMDSYGIMLSDSTVSYAYNVQVPLMAYANVRPGGKLTKNFNKAYLKNKVYYGGFTPVQSLPSSKVLMGFRLRWFSAESSVNCNFVPRIAVKFHWIMSFDQVLQLTNSTFVGLLPGQEGFVAHNQRIEKQVSDEDDDEVESLLAASNDTIDQIVLGKKLALGQLDVSNSSYRDLQGFADLVDGFLKVQVSPNQAGKT